MINDQAFTLLAGNPGPWDTEMLNSCDSLTKIQEDQHARGRRSAELITGIHGCYVRLASGLDNHDILARAGVEVDGTPLSAIQWGVKWAMEDPDNREFYVRKSDAKAYL